MQRPEALEGPGQGLYPGPGGVEAQKAAPAGAGQAPGDVKEAVAQPLGLGLCELAVQAQALRPCEEVLGDEHDEHPGGVEGEAVAREVQQAGGFGIFDAVLDVGVAAVAGFKVDDVARPPSW